MCYIITCRRRGVSILSYRIGTSITSDPFLQVTYGRPLVRHSHPYFWVSIDKLYEWPVYHFHDWNNVSVVDVMWIILRTDSQCISMRQLHVYNMATDARQFFVRVRCCATSYCQHSQVMQVVSCGASWYNLVILATVIWEIDRSIVWSWRTEMVWSRQLWR